MPSARRVTQLGELQQPHLRASASSSIVVFGRHGKMLFRLNAGEANVFEGTPECTGTSVTNDTEVIIV